MYVRHNPSTSPRCEGCSSRLETSPRALNCYHKTHRRPSRLERLGTELNLYYLGRFTDSLFIPGGCRILPAMVQDVLKKDGWTKESYMLESRNDPIPIEPAGLHRVQQVSRKSLIFLAQRWSANLLGP